MTRTTSAIGLLAVAAALAVAGCGSGGSGSSGGAYGEGGGSSSSGGAYGSKGGGGESSGAFVSLASVPGLGLILVDSQGLALYEFQKDSGTRPSCYGACAEAWPPLTTKGAPQPSNGASASKLGTTRRSDGTVQVTYAGHPLYTYAADKKPGEANGNGFSAFGAPWHALKGSGEPAGG